MTSASGALRGVPPHRRRLPHEPRPGCGGMAARRGAGGWRVGGARGPDGRRRAGRHRARSPASGGTGRGGGIGDAGGWGLNPRLLDRGCDGNAGQERGAPGIIAGPSHGGASPWGLQCGGPALPAVGAQKRPAPAAFRRPEAAPQSRHDPAPENHPLGRQWSPCLRRRGQKRVGTRPRRRTQARQRRGTPCADPPRCRPISRIPPVPPHSRPHLCPQDARLGSVRGSAISRAVGSPPGRRS